MCPRALRNLGLSGGQDYGAHLAADRFLIAFTKLASAAIAALPQHGVREAFKLAFYRLVRHAIHAKVHPPHWYVHRSFTKRLMTCLAAGYTDQPFSAQEKS
jgi:hypothetical protein